MDKQEAKEILTDSVKYFTIEDLRFNNSYGYKFSKEKTYEFLDIKNTMLKEGDSCFVKLPLKTFNSEFIYYCECDSLITNIIAFYDPLLKDFKESSTTIVKRKWNTILTARILSEIEGTLNIENVPTTRKRIQQIYKTEGLTDKNDIIIKNMANAISFILNEKPEFNKENLFKLYGILSNNCLDEEDELSEGYYYRDDAVTIGDYEGAPADKIEECMNSLFEFVKNEKTKGYNKFLLPHICHYYMLYIHPYFDYNGRTARMVSFWIANIVLKSFSPFFISEAINEEKASYYNAIKNTRDMKNDLTYFLEFIMETSIKYSLIYKNIEAIEAKLQEKGDFLTDAELSYIRKILIHNDSTYFNTGLFIKYSNNNMSKQAASKILNNLASYGILEKSKNKKSEAIYKISPNFLTYQYH